MNPSTPDLEDDMTDRSIGRPFSRRRLFEFGGAAVGLAAMLAACSKETAAEPGRVGNAPVPTDLPALDVNDAVYLRTMQSLEFSIIDVYGVLSGLDGLAQGTTDALARFTEDHTTTAAALGQLVSDNGGDPFECANPWLMERSLQPALDYVVGTPAEGEVAEIPPTDDADRDTLALINGLETLATATYQQMVEKLTTPTLRASTITFAAEAARRSATIAIMAGGDEDRFVSPELVGEELAADEEGFFPAYAIPSRFGQLTPIDVVIGAPNELDLRYTASFETPADNAYAHAELTCPA